jgi:hypothetical protein
MSDVDLKADERALKMYEQICINIRTSDDISFKLLGFVPLISGSGAAILANMLTPRNAAAIIATSVIAAMVTFGLFKWELRNVQKCEWLIQRAADIEYAWFGTSTGSVCSAPLRQFSEWHLEPKPPLFGPIPSSKSPCDPPPVRHWFPVVGKAEAERIIYWTSICAWVVSIVLASRVWLAAHSCDAFEGPSIRGRTFVFESNHPTARHLATADPLYNPTPPPRHEGIGRSPIATSKAARARSLVESSVGIGEISGVTRREVGVVSGNST